MNALPPLPIARGHGRAGDTARSDRARFRFAESAARRLAVAQARHARWRWSANPAAARPHAPASSRAWICRPRARCFFAANSVTADWHRGARAGLSPRRADGVPGPVRLAQSGVFGATIISRGRWNCMAMRRAEPSATSASPICFGCRPRSGGDGAQISARAVGRAAPARQHRPCACGRAGGAGRRRADLDARRVDPARHPRAAGPHQARAPARPALHHPRYRHRRACRRRGGRHVRRPDGRVGRHRRRDRRCAPSLYAAAALGGARSRTNALYPATAPGSSVMPRRCAASADPLRRSSNRSGRTILSALCAAPA